MSINGDLRATIQELVIEVEVLKVRLHERQDALKLQAQEYERRLADLNHAHQNAEKALATFTPREVFDRSNRDVLERLERATDETTHWRQKVEEFMSSNTGRNKGISDFWGWIAAAVTAAGAYLHWIIAGK